MAKKRIQGGGLNRARIIIENCDVEDIRLVNSACSLLLEDGELPDNLESKIESEGKLLGRHESIGMMHRMQMRGFYTGKYEADPSPLYIEAVFAARYSISNKIEITERDLESFAHTISLLHVWPYWREFVHSMSCRMGLPPITIPLFKIPGFGKAKKPSAIGRPKNAKKKKKRPT
jgi:hypothetical protein